MQEGFRGHVPKEFKTEKPEKLSKEEIRDLEFKARNEILDQLDNEEYKKVLGMEGGSREYMRAERNFNFAKEEFARKYGVNNPDEISEMGRFSRWTLFVKNPGMKKDLKAFELAKYKLNSMEENIINLTPEIFEDSETFQKILDSSEASVSVGGSGRSLLKKGIKKRGEMAPKSLRGEMIEQVDIISDKKGDEKEKAGQKLSELSEELQKRDEEITGTVRRIDKIKRIKQVSGIINFDGNEMMDTYTDMNAAKERLTYSLGFDPTEGSRLKNWIKAAYRLGREGMPEYKTEMKKYDEAKRELSRMEESLEQAISSIRDSQDPVIRRIKAEILQEGHRIERSILDGRMARKKIMEDGRNFPEHQRDIVVRIKIKALELSSENITKNEAEDRLRRSTGVQVFSEQVPYKMPEAINMITKFDLKIDDERATYGLFEINGVYSAKMLD